MNEDVFPIENWEFSIKKMGETNHLQLQLPRQIFLDFSGPSPLANNKS